MVAESVKREVTIVVSIVVSFEVDNELTSSEDTTEITAGELLGVITIEEVGVTVEDEEE